MPKYIRTMGCIYEVEKEYELKKTRYFEEGKYYKIKSDIVYIDIPEKLVVRIADTIEELCDMFVTLEKLDGTVWHSLNFTLSDDLRKDKNNDGVYGAIWTDKGLIYVAKMNNDGNLELL